MTLLFLYIGGLGYSALLDIVMAVSTMHFLNYFFFGFELTWYHYFLAAPIIGILPDITSTLLQLVTEKKVDDAHHDINMGTIPQIAFLTAWAMLVGRFLPSAINYTISQFEIPLDPIPPTDIAIGSFSVTMASFAGIFMLLAPLAHIPLLMMGAGFTLGSLFFSPFWGLVITISFFLHFFHDSCCLDFGLRWLWPFSNNQYHFGGRLGIGKIPPLPFKLIHVFKPDEIDRSQYMDVIEWVRRIYLVPTYYAICELVIAMIFVILVGMSMTNITGAAISWLTLIFLACSYVFLAIISTLYEYETGKDLSQ